MSSATTAHDRAPELLPALHRYLQAVAPLTSAIAPQRRQALDAVASYVRGALDAGAPAKLTFICTHNSRRSHMGQLWSAAAAAYCGVTGSETFSGGTEVTAFNPRAVAAMRRAGFVIEQSSDGAASDSATSNEPDRDHNNPRYRVTLGDNSPPQLCFSKLYDDPHNPGDDFAAIMTCTQADEACPIVHGAAARFALPYDDPKRADGSPQEAATYDARARQIATEMLYLFSQLRT